MRCLASAAWGAHVARFEKVFEDHHKNHSSLYSYELGAVAAAIMATIARIPKAASEQLDHFRAFPEPRGCSCALESDAVCFAIALHQLDFILCCLPQEFFGERGEMDAEALRATLVAAVYLVP